MVEAGGRVRSWTVQNRAFLGGFAEDVPFMLVDVEMDLATEQPEVRLIGRLLDGPDATISLGDAVEVAFEEIGGGFSVPAFRLAGPASRLASQ
jgi:uncharacterized OB-fold protein